MSAFVYIDNKSLLVVSKKNGLYRLNCPFIVVTIVEGVDSKCLDAYQQVTELRESAANLLEYRILNVFHPYHHYRLTDED